MKTLFSLKLALLVLTITMLTSCSDPSVTESVAVEAQTTQDTYLGLIEYQDQTITKASAAKLNRQIDLQRASQLTLWAMPISSFYQSYKATKINLELLDDEPVIGLYEGYDGVYPFITANVTTPYIVSMVDLSVTGPLIVNIPEGGVYGVANNTWQEPIKEIGSGKKDPSFCRTRSGLPERL